MNTRTISPKESDGIALIQSRVSRFTTFVDQLGIEAVANIRLVFQSMSDANSAWLADQDLEDLSSLFILCLRLVGLFPKPDTLDMQIGEEVVVALSKGGQMHNDASHAYLKLKNDNFADHRILWYVHTSKYSVFSLQRTLDCLFAYVFSQEYIYSLRASLAFRKDYWEALDMYSYSEEIRSMVMNNWNAIQDSKSEWRVFRV